MSAQPSWDNLLEEDKKLRASAPKPVPAAVAQPRAVAAAPRQPKKVTHAGHKIIAKVDGLTHCQAPELARATQVRDSKGLRHTIFVYGPKASGKTTVLEQLAAAEGLEYAYHGKTLMAQDLIGFVSQLTGKVHSTAFTRVFEHGGYVVFEELDSWSPQATLAINVPLANGYMDLPDGRRIHRHKDCVVVGCANTWGTGATVEYVGRNKLDDAFLDRFAIKIDFQRDEALEEAIVDNPEVIDLVRHARAKCDEYGIKMDISPRTSYAMADMCRAGYTLREAAENSFLCGLDHTVAARLTEDYAVGEFEYA